MLVRRKSKECIVVALDVDTLDKAKKLVDELAPYVGAFKIGLELMHRVGGPQATAAIHDAGGLVMYDAKLHDIPNTMAGATIAIAELGVRMFTVHASAGRESVAAAVNKAGRSKVVGVTVLTSIDTGECIEIFGAEPSVKVRQFAETLVSVHAHAIVCSAKEVGNLTDLPLLRITPGIRPAWAEKGDQKRVLSAGDAIRAGAQVLVIGRPITNPPAEVGTPRDAARRILEEVSEALS